MDQESNNNTANEQQVYVVDKNVRLFIDFFTFKFMILEVLVPILFVLSLLALLVWSCFIMRYSFLAGLGILVGGFFGIRIAFELIMVAFAILGTLRQIRDRLPDKSAQPKA